MRSEVETLPVIACGRLETLDVDIQPGNEEIDSGDLFVRYPLLRRGVRVDFGFPVVVGCFEAGRLVVKVEPGPARGVLFGVDGLNTAVALHTTMLLQLVDSAVILKVDQEVGLLLEPL